MTTKQYEWENTGFLESIQFEKKKDIIYLTRNGNPLTLTTPELRLPFGLDKNYNGFQLKLQCNHWDAEKDGEHMRFIRFLHKLEDTIRTRLNIDSELLPSQITLHPKYPPIVSTKIIVNRGDNIGTEFIDMRNNPVNMFHIDKGEIVVCKLLVDTIRPYKGKLWYKLKCKKVVCVKRH